MFFKNLLLYRLTQPLQWDIAALEQALASKPAREPASQELTTYGFVPPLGKKSDVLAVQAAGCILIATQKVERILPGGVVREAVAEKVDEIESEQLRKVYKKERDQIKDEVIQAFLPRAFVRRRTFQALLDPQAGLIYVNTASSRDAEDLLSTLREVTGSLPVRPVTVKIAPSATLTDWLKQQKAPQDFYVLDRCELSDTHEDGGTVRCDRQDLSSDEIQLHLGTGKVVTQLALAWQDKLSFVINDRLVIRGLRFEELLNDQAAEAAGDDADNASYMMASLTILAPTLRDFVQGLLQALGGEEVPDALNGAPAVAEEGDDVLYMDVVAHTRKTQQASISAVKKHFTIGFNRAARLVELMEARGVVSAPDDQGSRHVLASA